MASSEPPMPRPSPSPAGKGRDTGRNASDRDAYDHDEVSAIIRRAVEVATDDGAAGTDGGGLEPALSAADLAEVAAEVGVSPEALATALAESRAGLRRRSTLLDRLVGPGQVTGHAPADVSEDRTADNLRQWLTVEHGLDVHVDRRGVLVASQRTGLAGAVRTGIRVVRGRRSLDRVRSVRAATAEVDQAAVACVVVDVSNRRNQSMAGGSAVAGGSILVIGAVAALASPVALVALPVAVATGVGVARHTHGRTVDRVGEQVERTVVAAGRDETPTHPVERLLRAGLPRRRRAT